MGRIWFKSGGLLLFFDIIGFIIIVINTLADFLTTDCELSCILSVFSLYLFRYPTRLTTMGRTETALRSNGTHFRMSKSFLIGSPKSSGYGQVLRSLTWCRRVFKASSLAIKAY